LFFWLGVTAVIATVLTFAVLPLMRRLHAQHHSHSQASEGPLPTIGSEE
jgi:fatty acid desaturase